MDLEEQMELTLEGLTAIRGADECLLEDNTLQGEVVEEMDQDHEKHCQGQDMP